MKNIKSGNTMDTVKVASKELNILKVKIKDMIKKKEIDFEVINGTYYVDIQEVEKVLKSNSPFEYRKYYSSIIPKNKHYTSYLSNKFTINGKLMNKMITEIVNYWNDVGANFKILEYFGDITPIQYRLAPINGFYDKLECEKLFGSELDNNSMFIWVKQLSYLSKNSINIYNGNLESISNKEECKVGILNPSTKKIKVFDIDTITFDIESISWIETVKQYTLSSKMIDYEINGVLNLGVLSKPIDTAFLIATNKVKWQ